MIQSGWVGHLQNGRKFWSRRGCIYKIEIPIYRFFRYFFFGIRYFSVFGIPTSVLVSVTDLGLSQTATLQRNSINQR